jgi:hypothetical protein
MLDVWADVEKNRLFLRHLGPLDAADAQKHAESILREMSRLRPGFDVLVDLTRAGGPLEPTQMQYAQQLMVEANARGVARHVFIVGRAGATIQLERMARQMGHEGFLAASQEEAERLLERKRV